jgi:hypothetical protein
MTDHDALYHRLFSRPLMVEHLVRAFVPEVMAAGLQFDRSGSMPRPMPKRLMARAIAARAM